MKKPYSISLNQELRESLSRISKAQDRTLSNLVNGILRDWLRDYEKSNEVTDEPPT